MHRACMVEMRNVYKVLVIKRLGKRFLKRPRHRGEDNIKINIRERGLWVCTGFIWLRIGV
jgi:hypothetical protein